MSFCTALAVEKVGMLCTHWAQGSSEANKQRQLCDDALACQRAPGTEYRPASVGSRNLNFSIHHKQVTTHTHWISCMCICSDIQTLDKLTFTLWVQVEIEGISKYSDKNVHTQTHTRMQTQRVVWVPVESTHSRPNIATVTLAKSQLQKLFISTALRFPPSDLWALCILHESSNPANRPMNNPEVSLVSASSVSHHAWYFMPVFWTFSVFFYSSRGKTSVWLCWPESGIFQLPSEQYHKRGVIDTRQVCVEKRMYRGERYIFGELILAFVV